MGTVASLNLNGDEAGVLDAALLYYADTILTNDESDEASEEIRRDIRIAERLRERLRKSVARHGYRLEPRP
jgi:hypothetical protein